jgi:hypothetical protein
VRLIYKDGAGCYGMNGHDDAAADARCCRRSSGAPCACSGCARRARLGSQGPAAAAGDHRQDGPDASIAAWRTTMWLPRATANLPNIPLLAPQDAGIEQTMGLSTGLISQNGDPPYAAANVDVTVTG